VLSVGGQVTYEERAPDAQPVSCPEPVDRQPTPTSFEGTPALATLTGGVDTHLDVHIAAALNEHGALLGTESFTTTPAGYRRLLAWLSSFGDVALVGVEGTGAYGAGLARHLIDQGVRIVEVDRPNRQSRRRHGKSDTLDAIEAARAAFAGTATGQSKGRDGTIEAIRALRVARRSARTNRVQAINQLHALIAAAPDPIREPLRGLPRRRMIATVAAFRPHAVIDVTSGTKHALRTLARRVLALDAEIAQLDAVLSTLVEGTAPELLALHAVGPDSAGALLLAAGDNHARLRNEAAFARICGASPLPTGSGKRSDRHRLNKGGNRQANSALWRIVLVRMQSHEPTKRYVERRLAEGLSKRDIMRCLKRYVAREVFNNLPDTVLAGPVVELDRPEQPTEHDDETAGHDTRDEQLAALG
jgi:transposase